MNEMNNIIMQSVTSYRRMPMLHYEFLRHNSVSGKALADELPQFVQTVQKSTYVGNIKFYAEWRSVSGATPVLFWMRSWL